MSHPSWWVPQKHRAIDKQGLAVALAFLVAVGALAGGRGEKAENIHDRSHGAEKSVTLDRRPAAEGNAEDQRLSLDPRVAAVRDSQEERGPAAPTP